jgi:outer membrane immunogenic protein
VNLRTSTGLVGINYKFSPGGSLASTSSAVALPAPTYSETQIITDNWSGFYLGGQGWYAGSSGSYTFVQPAGSESFRFNPNSFIGGGHAGIQGQFGSGVFGIEGTYDVLDQNQTDIAVLFRGHLRTLTTNDIATVVGKAGYAAGAFLFYVKGGFADAKINTFALNPARGISNDADAWQAGYTVGSGIDYLFAKGWIAGVDFNYYDFRFNRSAVGSSGVVSSFIGKNDVYAGMFRLSYLFNWTSPVVTKY